MNSQRRHETHRAIRLRNICKDYPVSGGSRRVLDNVSLDIQATRKIGVLGRNGSGKSTLVRLISGAEAPSSGDISRGLSVSWPLAFTGGFQGSLTGADNLRFICRIYNTLFEDKVSYLQEFTELGRYLYEPVKTYSSGMRARLAFGISMCIEFECYLIDEVFAVGDARFHERCRVELFERRRNRSMLIVSHQPEFIRSYCDETAVLKDGRLHRFSDVSEGFEFYNDAQ